MNLLTIFLYLADIFGNLQGVLIMFALIGGAVIAIAVVMGAINASESRGEEREVHKAFAKKAATWSWAVLVLAILSAIIPSKDTMYLMAGSEVGEMVVTSDAAKEVVNKVSLAIDKMLEGKGAQ